MKSGLHSKKADARLAAATALALMLTLAGASQNAVAQGLVSPGADQDSLLPPEVVPLDPQAASTLSAAQAAKRQVQTGNASESSVPGLDNTQASGMQTAKEMRQAAFDALYGQGQFPQQQQMKSGVSYNGDPNLAPPYQTPDQQAQLLSSAQPAQTQTLTGGPKSQPKIRDIRRGGFTNNLSGATALGTGLIMSSFITHHSNPLVGLGIFGLTMTGFGVRNAFRF
jgi:hypothetical protein